MIKANVYVEYELIGNLSFDGEFYNFSYSEDFKNGLTKWQEVAHLYRWCDELPNFSKNCGII